MLLERVPRFKSWTEDKIVSSFFLRLYLHLTAWCNEVVLDERHLSMEAAVGNELFDQVVQATGLPTKTIENELEFLLHKAGKNSASLTMEDLREILSEYLQDVFLEIKKGPQRDP